MTSTLWLTLLLEMLIKKHEKIFSMKFTLFERQFRIKLLLYLYLSLFLKKSRSQGNSMKDKKIIILSLTEHLNYFRKHRPSSKCQGLLLIN
jgi:hypothetical protein